MKYRCGFVTKHTQLFNRKPIVYNMTRTGTGWRLSAYVPPNAPANDRLAVLNWLGTYQQQVKLAQPDWLVRFKASDLCNYELDVTEIKPSSVSGSNQAQLAKLDTLWHQLPLNYA
jgi:hypothetical protein